MLAHTVSYVKYTLLQYNIALKKQIDTVVYKSSLKHLYIEHRVYGYILAASRGFYMAGSLRYRRIRHQCINAHSVQC